MKKTYINPAMEIVKVQSLQLLAGSETLSTKGNYGDGNGITLSGRQSDFDDDEEY